MTYTCRDKRETPRRLPWRDCEARRRIYVRCTLCDRESCVVAYDQGKWNKRTLMRPTQRNHQRREKSEAGKESDSLQALCLDRLVGETENRAREISRGLAHLPPCYSPAYIRDHLYRSSTHFLTRQLRCRTWGKFTWARATRIFLLQHFFLLQHGNFWNGAENLFFSFIDSRIWCLTWHKFITDGNKIWEDDFLQVHFQPKVSFN